MRTDRMGTEFKRVLCEQVDQSIEHMKRAFHSGWRAARRARRAQQPWLKRLSTGGR